MHKVHKVRDQLVNMVDQLLKRQIFPSVVGGHQTRSQTRVNIGLKVVRLSET